MYILGVESSAVSAGAAVVKDGKVISEAFVNSGLTHSQTLMKLIDNTLDCVGLSVNDMDALAVAAGPGSFTGIRIGVATVKGLAFTCDKPCYAVSTLEALANAAFTEDCIICPVMDARCSQVYNALFRKENGCITRLCEDRPITLEELSEELKNTTEKILLAGDGSDITLKYMQEKGISVSLFSDVFRYQHASGVAITAWRMYNNKIPPVTGAELQPDYLRLSQAERELKKKEQNK